MIILLLYYSDLTFFVKMQFVILNFINVSVTSGVSEPQIHVRKCKMQMFSKPDSCSTSFISIIHSNKFKVNFSNNICGRFSLRVKQET